MSGRGKIAKTDQTPHPRVLVLDQKERWQPAVEPLHFDSPKMAGVGPGFAFGKIIAEKKPRITIGLVPSAVGGSPLRRW